MNRDTLKSALRRDEGFRSYAYQDSKGYWTIGVGHLIDRRGGGLKPQFIEMLLDDDIDEKISQLNKALPWWSQLDEVRQRVLVNMTFNLGVDGLLGFHNFLAALERKEFAAAADEMVDSDWHKEVGARAHRLEDAMRTGVDQ
jgi:lysozyme